ncbi:MAG: cupredoxin domain-containing protein [Burkholderiales bacterium]
MSCRRRSCKVLLGGFVALAFLLGAYGRDVWADSSTATLVTVRLVDDRFLPSTLTFQHAVLYHLHLENDGTTMHEFTAPTFFAAIEVKNPGVLEAGHGGLVLQPGERKELYFIAAAPGRYALSCADHDWDGMTGNIIVE